MSESDGGGSRLVLAIDYGTTYTGMAYATPSAETLPLSEITSVEVWNNAMDNHKKVPSVKSYSHPSERGEEQWGSDLSPDAISMVHTKLELHQQNVSDELNLILQALEGMDDLKFDSLKQREVAPGYSDKSAEEIVTDFLVHVFQAFDDARAADLIPQDLLSKFPTTIVATVPTVWGYQAKNATYRALTKAGANKDTFPGLVDIVLVTEPEAAAMYTARYLKGDRSTEFLKEGECFILCDAGGGTVDVVSYKVIQVDPSLELQRIAIPTGDTCGSIHIDIAFKQWLRATIGEKYYRQLDGNPDAWKISNQATEGQKMRIIMQAFEDLKIQFEKKSKDMHIELPKPLDKVIIPGVVDRGELKIPKAMMEKFFGQCVAKILKLIEGQMNQIKRKNKTCKNIFLVGGFGESKYLQEELELSLRLRRVKLRVPETAMTAVVQGAVICGVERGTMPHLSIAEACHRHYGICVSENYSVIHHDEMSMAKSPHMSAKIAVAQMVWLISKGDLILSDQPHEIVQDVSTYFGEKETRPSEVIIWSNEEDEEDRPTQYQGHAASLQQALKLTYRLGTIPNYKNVLEKVKCEGKAHYKVATKLSLVLSKHGLHAKLSWRDMVLDEQYLEWDPSDEFSDD